MTSRRPWRNKIESGQFSFYLLYSYVRYVVMKKLSWGKVGESIIKLSIDKINDCHNENCFWAFFFKKFFGETLGNAIFSTYLLIDNTGRYTIYFFGQRLISVEGTLVSAASILLWHDYVNFSSFNKDVCHSVFSHVSVFPLHVKKSHFFKKLLRFSLIIHGNYLEISNISST
jgi:hypothetical protein